MYPILEDKRYHRFDILAIQEPWENLEITISINLSSSPYHLLYSLRMGARIYVYIYIKGLTLIAER